MGRVRARREVRGLVEEVERLWHDPVRWPAWMDGFASVSGLDPAWPAAGATLVWDSRPGGRGRVLERVVAHDPGAGHAVAVEDERLRGTQRVSFTQAGPDVEIAVELDYELKQRRPGGVIVDVLFIRRALGDSLRRSLYRFSRELEADRELSG